MFDEEGELQENNQIVKTINIVDNNELSSDLFISFYIYHRKDSSNNHSYYIEAEFIEFIQYSSGDLPVSNAWNKELSSTENLIPTLLGIIYEALNKSIDYELKIKSVEKEKILIQIDHDQILPRTEYNVQKSIDFKNIESIQNTIHEIKLFIECCKQKEDINEDINCLKLDEHPSTYGWNDNLIMELDSIINNYSTTLTDNKTYGIETSVLITEVYDSIAVGKIIDYNENACIKVLPGDILIPIK